MPSAQVFCMESFHAILHPLAIARLFFCQDGRQSFRLFSAHGVNGAFQVLLKHLALEEQESAKGLVLRRGGNVLTDSRMGEKGLSEKLSGTGT
ncbi:MAG: hypothetical protein DDT27_01531 [Dehalococcoidia bacterium]|nr:hypothetical protein [Chloroflexota bacterium]MBT9161397.1 hypothetical protein [Chloroflexota bacterium]MBT9162966.1 hypothetical protein [Chloroflexota bacterium]